MSRTDRFVRDSLCRRRRAALNLAGMARKSTIPTTGKKPKIMWRRPTWRLTRRGNIVCRPRAAAWVPPIQRSRFWLLRTRDRTSNSGTRTLGRNRGRIRFPLAVLRSGISSHRRVAIWSSARTMGCSCFGFRSSGRWPTGKRYARIKPTSSRQSSPITARLRSGPSASGGRCAWHPRHKCRGPGQNSSPCHA